MRDLVDTSSEEWVEGRGARYGNAVEKSFVSEGV